MSDDLVKRLRELTCNCYDAEVIEAGKDAMDEAASRIEKLERENNGMVVHFDGLVARIKKLEAALHEWDALIHHQYTGSREAMSDMQYAAQITAALLHGEAPWPETRIEKLEAALDEAAFSQTLFDAVVGQRNKATDRIEKLEDELHHCFHRIEELQTALREIAYTEPEDKYWPGRIARKALEDKQ